MMKLHNFVTFIKRLGINDSLQDLYYQWVNHYHERRLGVSTAYIVRLSNLGINMMDARDYMPIGYNAIYSIIKKIPLCKSNCVFLDYGAGKGRAIIVAAQFPFKKVIGVEISEELITIAKTNIQKMKHRKAQCIQLHQVNAAEFILPQEVNVIYFFNPFVGGVLQKVIYNIYSSYKQHPRRIFIIYFKDAHFEKMTKNQDWIEKKYQAQFYPYLSCGVYETVTT